MAIFSNIISVIFLVFFVSIASSNNPGNELQTLTQSINHFTADFNKAIYQLGDYAGKNFIMSPMSAHMVLSMLSLGAKGDTLDELNSGLYLSNSEFTKKAYKQEMVKLNASHEITLMIANKVYVKEGTAFELAPNFKNDTKEVFNSEVENIDFTQGTSAAAKINAWVEDKTNKTIKDFIDASDLTNDTTLVLVNTIYFTGEWKEKFDPNKTKKADFGIDNTTVDMMYQTTMFNYGESTELDAKILELPLKGDEMTMLLLLPNEFNGLAAIEEKMNGTIAPFSMDTSNFKPEMVDVALPKFQINSTIDLAVVLHKLDMGTIFTDDAELGGLLIKPTPLKVTKAIQKAFIDVNEEGVTASTVSAVETNSTSPPNVKQFFADHPFLFAFFKNGQKMFSGKFTNKE